MGRIFFAKSHSKIINLKKQEAKMKIRKILSILLIVCMLATVFVACGEKEKDDGKSDPSDSGTVSNDANKPDDNQPDDEETPTITVWLPDMGNSGAGHKSGAVADAIQALALEEINVNVEITWISMSDIGTQFVLAVANNEPVDIYYGVPTTTCNFLSLHAQGCFMDITPYLDNAPDIVALSEEMGLLDAFERGGAIYGIPTYRQYNSNLYICCRMDILEETGNVDKFYGLKTWSEYEELLQDIKDLDKMYATGSGWASMLTIGFFYGMEDSLSSTYAYDQLGDALRVLYTDENGNVSNAWEEEDLLAQLKKIKGWNDSGFMYPDSAYNKDTTEVLVNQNVLAAWVVTSEYGIEVNKANACGMEIACLEIAPGMLKTSAVQGFYAGIPTTAAEPAAALKFMNFLYTSEECMNLINWGIEGETYVLNAEGFAEYPEGTDPSTCGYHNNDYLLGNQFLTIPWQGSGAITFREDALANMKNAPTSKYLGLTVDVSDYGALVAAIKTVVDEYDAQLTCGTFSDSIYNEFLGKLDSAGIDEYLGLYQTAVDDFLA